MSGPLRVKNYYFDEAFDDPSFMVTYVRDYLVGLNYDTMIGTGLSGTLVIPTLARALGKYWAIVRKADNAHSGLSVEGTIGSRWIFVDDFVSTGATRANVCQKVADFTAHHAHVTKFVGTFQYNGGYTPWIPAP